MHAKKDPKVAFLDARRALVRCSLCGETWRAPKGAKDFGRCPNGCGGNDTTAPSVA